MQDLGNFLAGVLRGGCLIHALSTSIEVRLGGGTSPPAVGVLPQFGLPHLREPIVLVAEGGELRGLTGAHRHPLTKRPDPPLLWLRLANGHLASVHTRGRLVALVRCVERHRVLGILAGLDELVATDLIQPSTECTQFILVSLVAKSTEGTVVDGLETPNQSTSQGVRDRFGHRDVESIAAAHQYQRLEEPLGHMVVGEVVHAGQYP